MNSTNFALPVGSKALQQIAERKADPRDDHRPAFDAAMAVDTLFERMRLEDVFERVGAGLGALAFDRHRPRLGLEAPAFFAGSLLSDAELVVVVERR